MNSIANKKNGLELLIASRSYLFAKTQHWRIMYSRITRMLMKNISQKSRHYGNFMIHFHRKNIMFHISYSSINTIMTALPHFL